MNWFTVAVQWFHVLLGITWFGYAISLYFLVGPALAELPEDQGRITNSRLGEIGRRVFPIVSVLVLLLGILRGTVFGRIQSFDALLTTYGIVWLIALVFTLGLIFTGARYMGPGPGGDQGHARLSRHGRAHSGDFADRPRAVRHRLHLHDPHALPVSG